MRCKGTKADGSPCGTPERFVDAETGYCASHGPGAAERLSEWGAKGGKKGTKAHLDDAELPPLTDPRAAETWLETVARAVATGRLTHNEGRTIARLVREWLRAREAGAVEERMETLEERLAALKRGELEVA